MTQYAEPISYELAILQFRPDVTSEELVNIGVVAFSVEAGLLATATTERYGRLKAVYSDLDGVAFRNLVRAVRSRAASIAKELGKDRLALDGRPDGIMGLLDRIVPPGSANFSWSAENRNVEFGVLLDDRSLAEAVEREIAGVESTLYQRVRAI